MISQNLRKLAPELDPLRMGTGYKKEDLEKIQIMIESTFGDSHPGSSHLLELTNIVRDSIYSFGGKASRFFTTDICDGMSQGHDGGNYSLVSRDMICGMAEIHYGATPFDACVFISSCDKSVPAHLMAIGRIDAPSILLTGGVMDAGPNLLTLEQIGMYDAMFKRGEISEDELTYYKLNACPSAGACSFMGTASTMQIMGEALGLMLPGSSLLPATSDELLENCILVGKQIINLAKENITPKKIVTLKSFENAIMVHAAISGSTNSLLHLPAIAKEFDIEIDSDTFDRLHRNAHYLLNIRPAGKWPAQFYSYAGGTPMIMEQIKNSLHLDVMTVTGKTLGENLENIKNSDYYEKCFKNLEKYTLKPEDIIRSFENPISKNGAVSILKGNLAPEGAVVKHSAVPAEMFKAILTAKPFDCEEDAKDAVLSKKICAGDAVIIRYEGPKGSGMPEMFYTTEAISSDPELSKSIALITDGRFSGASKGPVIGHVSPEACDLGPIALVEENDLIELDINERILSIVGIKGIMKTPEEIYKVLLERKSRLKRKPLKFKKGVLKLFCEKAVSPMKGGYIK